MENRFLQGKTLKHPSLSPQLPRALGFDLTTLGSLFPANNLRIKDLGLWELVPILIGSNVGHESLCYMRFRLKGTKTAKKKITQTW